MEIPDASRCNVQTAKETYNKCSKMTDGCPDSVSGSCQYLDFDGDGIADLHDSCPLEPETVNGYLDLDGCPDTVNIWIQTGRWYKR